MNYSIFLKLSLFLINLCWFCNVNAQESINSSGGSSFGNNGNASFSIGQVFYNTTSNNIGNVAQGVQHAYEIFNVGISNKEISLSIIAFPNPAVDILYLKVMELKSEKITIKVYNISGNLLHVEKIEKQLTKVNLSEYPPSTYFVNVSNSNNNLISSFKIIKK